MSKLRLVERYPIDMNYMFLNVRSILEMKLVFNCGIFFISIYRNVAAALLAHESIYSSLWFIDGPSVNTRNKRYI